MKKRQKTAARRRARAKPSGTDGGMGEDGGMGGQHARGAVATEEKSAEEEDEYEKEEDEDDEREKKESESSGSESEEEGDERGEEEEEEEEEEDDDDGEGSARLPPELRGKLRLTDVVLDRMPKRKRKRPQRAAAKAGKAKAKAKGPSKPLRAIRALERRGERPAEVKRCGARALGHGAFARRALRKGEWLFEYAGERRLAPKRRGGERYVWQVDDETGEVIDASRWGNESRFLNHFEGVCAAANVEVSVVDEADGAHVVFRAARAVAAGEQLVLNYGKEFRPGGFVGDVVLCFCVQCRM